MYVKRTDTCCDRHIDTCMTSIHRLGLRSSICGMSGVCTSTWVLLTMTRLQTQQGDVLRFFELTP